MITVVDYRAGNGPSVAYALEKLGIAAQLTGDPDMIASAERIILPGVGAARATIDSLTESCLVEPLTRRVHDDGVPFLGICIGLQVLFEHSEEGNADCLGWVPGTVTRFPDSVRVPQIGWNAVQFTRPHPLVEGLPADGYFYFVNSYFCRPANPHDALGVTEYAGEFCSVVARGNIAATQFHAEKSGPLGLRILSNFAAWSPG